LQHGHVTGSSIPHYATVHHYDDQELRESIIQQIEAHEEPSVSQESSHALGSLTNTNHNSLLGHSTSLDHVGSNSSKHSYHQTMPTQQFTPIGIPPTSGFNNPAVLSQFLAQYKHLWQQQPSSTTSASSPPSVSSSPSSGSPPSSSVQSSATNYQTLPFSIHPSQLAIPLAAIPPVTPVGIDPTTGHYIVVPAPWNIIFYTTSAYQQNPNSDRITSPIPPLSRTPVTRKRRPAAKRTKSSDSLTDNGKKEDDDGKEEVQKQKGTAPSDIKCLEIRVGNYHRIASRVCFNDLM
jgi:hypothetical protein